METAKHSQTKQSGPVIVVKTKHSTTTKQTGMNHINQAKEHTNKPKVEKQHTPIKEKTSSVPAPSKNFMDVAHHFQFKKVFQSLENKKNNVIEWGSPNNPFLQRRKLARGSHASNVKQLLLSIGGAVLIGTVMGFSILNLFFTDHPPSHSSNSIDDHLPKQLPAQSPQKKEEIPVMTQPLPKLGVVLLQAGNFQEKSGAQKMIQSYRTRGLAAVMSEQSPYRIFLGIGLNRDDALKLSSIYQKQDVQVYLKEMNIEGGVGGLSSKDAKKLGTIIQTGNQLVQELGLTSVRDIQLDANRVPNRFSFKDDFIDKHRQFVTESQVIETSLPVSARAPLTDMTRALDQAVQSGQEAQKNPSQALLWQIQEGLVRYAIAYEQLVQVLQ